MKQGLRRYLFVAAGLLFTACALTSYSYLETTSELLSECSDILHTCVLQPPTKSTAYHLWKLKNWGLCFNSPAKKRYIQLDCDKRLDLYSTVVLGRNDKLPLSVTKAVLDESQFIRLTGAYRAISALLHKHKIPRFVGFGNILSIARSRTLIGPWDDDIDIVVEDSAFEGFVKSLPCQSFTQDKSRCKRWKLSEHVTMRWKNWGMPYKVYSHEHTWPCVDIMTYKVDELSIEIPNEQIRRGHVKSFKMPRYELYESGTTLKTVALDVNVSHAYLESVWVHIPEAYIAVTVRAYGSDALDICKTSFIHKGTCKRECSRPAMNMVRKFVFPSCLLPQELRHGLYSISSCHSGISEQGAHALSLPWF